MGPYREAEPLDWNAAITITANLKTFAWPLLREPCPSDHRRAAPLTQDTNARLIGLRDECRPRDLCPYAGCLSDLTQEIFRQSCADERALRVSVRSPMILTCAIAQPLSLQLRSARSCRWRTYCYFGTWLTTAGNKVPRVGVTSLLEASHNLPRRRRARHCSMALTFVFQFAISEAVQRN